MHQVLATLLPDVEFEGASKERRISRRFNVSIKAGAIVPGHARLVPILVRNISRQGLSFETKADIRLGEAIRIVLSLPGRSPVEIQAGVRHIERAASERDGWKIVGAELENQCKPAQQTP